MKGALKMQWSNDRNNFLVEKNGQGITHSFIITTLPTEQTGHTNKVVINMD